MIGSLRRKPTHNSRVRRKRPRRGKGLKLLKTHQAWLRRKIREEDKGW